jgi:Leucine-rich repeat (LRR) protein
VYSFFFGGRAPILWTSFVMDAVHYQRAVTPTISSANDVGIAAATSNSSSSNASVSNGTSAGIGAGSGMLGGASNTAVRGKILSYQSLSQKDAASSRPKATGGSSLASNGGVGMGAQSGMNIPLSSGAGSPSGAGRFSITGRGAGTRDSLIQLGTNGGGMEMNVQGKSHAGGASAASTPTASKSMKVAVVGAGDSVLGETGAVSANNSFNNLIRHDLVPLSDDVPSDGIIFARYRNQPDSLVVFRTPEERLRNPERLNLDRRQLEVCPILEQEHRLRLLNFQNNNIKVIQNLENLSNLIFLDLYNNKLQSLEGPLSSIKGLRVLMAGKNKVSMISNLTQLRKLDVLDLHSNEIRLIEGLAKLTDLRVLNLAGNRINIVQNLSTLHALTELNLRRNKIEKVLELDRLPALQRVFLSHNLIANIRDMGCLFNVKLLIELSLDGNPISEHDNNAYRVRVIAGMPSLRHLDLKRITDEERACAITAFSALEETADGLLETRAGEADEGAVTNLSSKSLLTTGRPKSPGSSIPAVGSSKSLLSLAADAANGHMLNNEISTSSSFHGGLAALARAGKLPSSQSLFDLEIIGPNEKALVAVGDTWEWVQAKRLLATVVEASLLHVKKEIVVARFISNISSLPSLRNFRLMYNDIDSIHDLLTIFDSLGSSCRQQMETFTILHNPVCVNFYNLMKAYALLSFPRLKVFNEDSVCLSDFSRASQILSPLLNALSIGAASPAAGYLINNQTGAGGNGGNSLAGFSSLAGQGSVSLTTPKASASTHLRGRRDGTTLVSNASSIAYRRVSVLSAADGANMMSVHNISSTNAAASVADMSAAVVARREIMRLFDVVGSRCVRSVRACMNTMLDS